MKQLLCFLGTALLLTTPLAHAQAPVTTTRDGVYSFQLDAASGDVTINDLLNQKKLTASKVCNKPVASVLSVDEANLLIACAGDKQIAYLNTASFQVVATVALKFAPAGIVRSGNEQVAVIKDDSGTNKAFLQIGQRALQASAEDGKTGSNPDPAAAKPEAKADGKPDAKSNTSTTGKPNQVIVLGTLHGEHKKSKKYSLAILEKMIASIKPDVVLAEIPPNRFEAAAAQFKQDGKISELRVAAFPEYVDVLFPLQKTMGFRIVPVSAWNAAMDAYREQAWKEIQTNLGRRKEWATLQATVALSQMRVKQGGASDDPAWIHTDGYDTAVAVESAALTHFDKDLGPGGWETINRAHYAHMTRWLDQHANEGKRVLIMFGAAHKGWLLPQLKQRKDIEVLPLQQHLPK